MLIFVVFQRDSVFSAILLLNSRKTGDFFT